MQIYDHDSPETITFKNNSIELESWIEHLYYIAKEITNLLNLENLEVHKNEASKTIRLKLKKESEDNTRVINDFLKYKEVLPKATECEDADCDMFYITEHEKFRKKYMLYLKKYREVKEEYFSILSK
ncbi:hypothetical protein [Aequorivita sp. Q41]|uniref:hypothetical protein n=1 Tax=Aequorivita sp. Q41 TaxID=3153300 RepID=UPI00324225C1